MASLLSLSGSSDPSADQLQSESVTKRKTSGWTLTCFGVVKVETGKGDVGHVPVSSVVV